MHPHLLVIQMFNFFLNGNESAQTHSFLQYNYVLSNFGKNYFPPNMDFDGMDVWCNTKTFKDSYYF